MKTFFLLLCTVLMWGGTIAPIKRVKTSSPVLDLVVRDGKVYAGTDKGEIVQIDSRGKIVSSVSLKPFKNAWGETTVPKVMSLDLSPDGQMVAAASEEGRIYLFRGRSAEPTSFETRTVIKKIAFVSNTKLMIALLSNEIVWFDLKSDAVLKTISAGTSPLSDMAVSTDRKTAVTAGEAGTVTVLDTEKMKIVRVVHGGNVDNVYKLDLQNDRIVTAGQDRRVIVYTLDGKSYVRYNGTFLVYSAALSPSASTMAAAMDESNTISFYNVKNRRLIAKASGHLATLNRIAFIDEKRIVSSADENQILYWELP